MSSQSAEPGTLGFLLGDVYRLLRQDFERRVQDTGLTMTQWRAIAHLSREPGVRQSDLAAVLDVSPITLTRLIDRMESSSWVERRPDPNDRRATRLYLTSTVQPLLDTLHEKAAEATQLAFADFPDASRSRFVKALEKMKGNLRNAQGRTR